MAPDLLYETNQTVITLGFIALIALATEAGFRLGRRPAAVARQTDETLLAINSAQLAMLGLIIGFTFAMSMSRYENRKTLMLREATDIGTASLRAEFLPMPERLEVKALLREYVDVRLDFFDSARDQRRLESTLAHGHDLQRRFWAAAVAGANRESTPPFTALLFQALNDVIDDDARRVLAMDDHVPDAVLIVLFVFSAITMASVGFRLGRTGDRHAGHLAVFTIVLALLVTLILDLDRPRRGMIRVTQRSLIELQHELAPPPPGR